MVVAGYGHCGKGTAMRARGLGGQVIITEVDPIAALKATLEGFQVMQMNSAAKLGDIFITTTGMKDIITENHFKQMKDGAVICNTGHYDCELNLEDLQKLSTKSTEIRLNNEEYLLNNNRKIYLLAKGRLVNLAAAEGHPSEVMDMSFANQFLSLINLATEGNQLSNSVYPISPDQDQKIAQIKLQTMGINIDTLSESQKKYLSNYSDGT